MRYAAILGNDVLDGFNGVTVSFWTQGCPFHCKGCHNQHTWDFNGGKEDTVDNIVDEIKHKLVANGVHRNFSILGGEPLCEQNVDDVLEIIKRVREEYPEITIAMWTGYTLENLRKRDDWKTIDDILEKIDILVDGPFIEALRDVDLAYRGSSNQRILRKGYDF